MRVRAIPLQAAIVALALHVENADADLMVDSWLLGTTVSSSPFSNSDATDVVQNPYAGVLFATLGDSSSTASHDFSWTVDSARFDIAISHHAEQLRGRTISEVRIHLVPSVDSIITGWGQWQYAWPNSAEGDTIIAFNVIDITDPKNLEIVAIDTDYGGNFDLGPPFGTLNVDGSGILLAGHQYELFYNAQVYFYTTTPSGDASGEFHFSIEPVPEPISLGLLVLAMWLFVSARRRR